MISDNDFRNMQSSANKIFSDLYFCIQEMKKENNKQLLDYCESLRELQAENSRLLSHLNGVLFEREQQKILKENKKETYKSILSEIKKIKPFD